MGQKTVSPYQGYQTTERLNGNRRSIFHSTRNLKVMVDALPRYGHKATPLCLSKGEFKEDMDGSIQLPAWEHLGSETERPRSRSIPIKIKAAEADDSDGNRDSNMYSYDLATWRMYNRIVDHRQKYPVNFSQNIAPSEISGQASDVANLYSRYRSSDNVKLASCERVDPVPVPDSNYYYLEGEVFELEL
jgi:hypothetical protein